MKVFKQKDISDSLRIDREIELKHEYNKHKSTLPPKYELK